MQSNVVKAFRRRLVRAGFSDIMIIDLCNGSYSVSCRDRDGNLVREILIEIQMPDRPFLFGFLFSS